jgi:HEAT repeat protein
MNNIGKKLAAVALALCASAAPAFAGKGGSAALIKDAVRSGSQDAILAEVERAESLMCEECIPTMIALTEDNRVAVRQVAAWWFAKRPGTKAIMVSQMKDDLIGADSFHVRNAADFVGFVREYTALPQLREAIKRTDLNAEAKLAIVRSVGYMAHLDGNGILLTAMTDTDATVRAAAVEAWRDILGQMSVTPIVGMLSDSDAKVRAQAATVVGAYADRAALSSLEQLVVNDPDAVVRRNAAWALGKIGSLSSTQALVTATRDSSGIVAGYAKAALATLK